MRYRYKVWRISHRFPRRTTFRWSISPIRDPTRKIFARWGSAHWSSTLDSNTIRAPHTDTRRTTTAHGPHGRQQVNATTRPRTGRPRFTAAPDDSPDGSWWVVRKPADLPPGDFATVHSKLRSLHANGRRTCHPSVSHLAVTMIARPSGACPSLAVRAGNTQQHRSDTVRCTHARRTRGGIR